MDRPRLIRRLRIAGSVWWGIICVLLVVLWVRSFRTDDFIYNRNSMGDFATIGSNRGTAYYLRWRLPTLSLFQIHDWRNGSVDASEPQPLFQWRSLSAGSPEGVTVPFWFPVLLVVAIAAA